MFTASGSAFVMSTKYASPVPKAKAEGDKHNAPFSSVFFSLVLIQTAEAVCFDLLVGSEKEEIGEKNRH